VLVSLSWLVLTLAATDLRFFATAGDSAALRWKAMPPEYSRLGRVVVLGSRRMAHFLLEYCTTMFLMPNVRVNRATTAGHQARDGENVPRTAGPGLVACRWRSG
jgi:hypothetical protein